MHSNSERCVTYHSPFKEIEQIMREIFITQKLRRFKLNNLYSKDEIILHMLAAPFYEKKYMEFEYIQSGVNRKWHVLISFH